MEKKNLDLLVANPVGKANAGFGSETNTALLLDKNGSRESLPLMSKDQMAHVILDRVMEKMRCA